MQRKRVKWWWAGLVIGIVIQGAGLSITVAQDTVSPQTVLATVADEKITLEDLAFAYKKAPQQQYQSLLELPYDSVKQFLELYINFRLKVLEAKRRGYDKDSAVLAEIRRHRNAVAVPYFFERVLIDPQAQKIAKRREWELKAAVILVGVGADRDSVQAYKQARRLLDSIAQGADFSQLARRYSDDRFSAERGGELPWITGGQVLRELEEPLYQLQPGEVFPEPIFTKFGFFIVKLLKKEPHIWVKGRHILVATSANRDSAAAYRRADSLLQRLRQGDDFAQLARQFSDDRNTAANGGDLGAYYSRSLGLIKFGGQRLVPEFEAALFSLRDGEISDIVQTNYGFHIIRRDSSKRVRAEDVLESVKRYYKTTYFQQDRRRFLDSVRRALGYGWNEEVFDRFLANLDTTKTTLDSLWDATIPEALRSEILYYTPFGGLTVGAWIDSLKTQPKYRGVALRRAQLRSAINRAMETVLLQQLTQNLEEQFEDFARLMREFHDGILLFKVENEEVWSKLKFDSLRARAYYDSTKERYWTGRRYEISEIYLLSRKAADSVYAFVLAHPEKFDSVASVTTQRRGYREKAGYWGEIDVKYNTLAKKLDKMQLRADTIVLVPYERGYSIIRVHRILPPRQKTFEEAIPDFATRLQDEIQKELTERWIATLRQRFPVRINEPVIRNIWKR